jgi:hypothetical protein
MVGRVCWLDFGFGLNEDGLIGFIWVCRTLQDILRKQFDSDKDKEISP